MDLPSPVAPDDVLAQPTRARLFALLAELKRPAGTQELAERLGLHPNGIRAHLERMEQVGLVQRRRVRHQRGRPPDSWAVAPDARPGGRSPLAYQDLGRWLARALRTPSRGLRGVEETGRQIGRELAPEDPAPDSDAFLTSLTALGFQPSSETHEDGGVRFCLGNCPYRDAVRENQPAVCALHRGITQGLLETIEPGARLAGFVPRDPDEAGCLIEVRPARPEADS